MTEDLATRVEALTGPCRETDAEIWWRTTTGRTDPELVTLFNKNAASAWDSISGPVWRQRPEPVPPYTASLDAAMKLADGLSETTIWNIWNEALRECSKRDGDLRKDIARFWTAAALRARGL